MTVGRSPGNAVGLTWEPEISRMHARLEWCRLGWVLVDGSRNGSLVDGKEVRGRRLLRDGAVVTVGTTPLLFRSSGTASAAVAAPDVATVQGSGALLRGLPPVESDVLAAVLAATPVAFRAGRPEDLLAEALALPAEEVDDVLGALCRRLGVRDSGPARVPDLGTRARALGIVPT